MEKEELSNLVYLIFDSLKELEEKGIFSYEKFQNTFIYFKTVNGKILEDFTKWIRYLNSEVVSSVSVVENLTPSEYEPFNGVTHLLIKCSNKAFEWCIEDLGENKFVFYETAVYYDENFLNNYNVKNELVISTYYRNFSKEYAISALEQVSEPWERRIRHLYEILTEQEFIYVLMDNENVTYERGSRYSKPYVIEKGGYSEFLITPLSTLDDFVYYDFEKANFSAEPFLSCFEQKEFFDLCKVLSSQTNARFEVHLENGIVIGDIKEIQTCIDRKNEFAINLDRKTLEHINKNDVSNKRNVALKKSAKINKKLIPLYAVILACFVGYFVLRTPFVSTFFYSTNNYDTSYFNLIEKYRGFSKNVKITPTSTVLCNKKNYTPEVITADPFSYSDIKSITITGCIKYIDDFAFANCEKLSSVKLYKKTREINNCAFMNCPLLEEIEIPPSVYHIGIKVFEGDNIKKLTIGQNLYEKYGKDLGNGITEDTEIIFTDDSKAFDPLTYCKIEKTGDDYLITEISSPFPVFVVPDNIKYLMAPMSTRVTDHKKYTFSYGYLGKYSKITEFIIPDSVVSIDMNFFKDSNIKSIIIPDSVTEIGISAFENSALEEIQISKNLKHLGYDAFYNTQLKKIIVNDGVNKVELVKDEQNNKSLIEVLEEYIEEKNE